MCRNRHFLNEIPLTIHQAKRTSAKIEKWQRLGLVPDRHRNDVAFLTTVETNLPCTRSFMNMKVLLLRNRSQSSDHIPLIGIGRVARWARGDKTATLRSGRLHSHAVIKKNPRLNQKHHHEKNHWYQKGALNRRLTREETAGRREPSSQNTRDGPLQTQHQMTGA